MSLLFQPIKSITVPELKEKLLEKPVLLDVRTPVEYRGRHIKGAKNIHQITAANNKHSLVFGNESSGLPDDYLKYGQSVFIPHSDKIDSLNLSMALGITLCHFSMMEFKDKQVLR